MQNSEFLFMFFLVIMGLSALCFVVAIPLLFPKSTRKMALRMLIISGIVFVIGFSTCLAVLPMNFR